MQRHEGGFAGLVQQHDEARQKRRAGQGGSSRSRAPRILPPPADPMAVARAFLTEARYEADGALMLRHWRGGWWTWQTTHWREAEPRMIRRLLYAFTETAVFEVEDGLAPWRPTRRKIDDLIDALAGLVLLPIHVDQPSWLDERQTGRIVSCRNGLLDIERRELLPHSPQFFNIVSVPFDYEPRARVPRAWRNFLKALWPRDHESRKALTEWFGYVISGRLDLHRILLMVGPTRAGKGVISRVLGAMIGPKNVAGPTLSSLAGDFGLAPLIGKALAVFSDARLSGKHGNVVVERLLSISGEDYLTVNIKYKEQWTGQLPCRLFVISNELPELGDASAAIVGRFIVLMLETSWLGRENIELERGLKGQLPGILNWSLMGLAKLEKAGRFIAPKSAQEAISALYDMASPTRTFLREECQVGQEFSAPVDEVFAAYKTWAEETGQPKITKQTFGKNLRAVLPKLRVVRLGSRDSRIRIYRGVRVIPKTADE